MFGAGVVCADESVVAPRIKAVMVKIFMIKILIGNKFISTQNYKTIKRKGITYLSKNGTIVSPDETIHSNDENFDSAVLNADMNARYTKRHG